MHTEVRQFISSVRQLYPAYFFRSRVIEMGSLNVCGSVRHFFWFNKKYIGVDLGHGKGVDIVSKAHQYMPPFNPDVVVSCEMLEHDENWKLSLAHMYSILKPYGLFLFTCAGPDREEHGTTDHNAYGSPFTTSYYRNISMHDFEAVLYPELFLNSSIMYNRGRNDLYFWGIKKPQYIPTSRDIYEVLKSQTVRPKTSSTP
jgi:hypothetical protein